MTDNASLKDFADLPYQPQAPAGDRSDPAVPATTRSPRVELWLNVARTVNVILCSMAMGTAMALTAVTLLELMEIYRTSLSAIVRIFITRTAGGLVGALIGGKLYDTYNVQVVTILAMTMHCFAVLMIPISGYLPLAHVMAFLLGLSMDALYTGTTVWTMKMWPENSSPALQFSRLSYAVGFAVAPFIARPFFSTVEGDSMELFLQNMNMTMNDTGHTPIDTPELLNAEALDVAPSSSTIYYPFLIVSGFELVLVAFMTVLYFIDNASFKTRRTNNAATSVEGYARNTRFAWTTLALFCAHGFVYVAVESAMSPMLVPFAMECDLDFSLSLAARLASVYHFSSIAGCLAAALVGIKLVPFYVLAASQAVLVTSGIILLASGSSCATALWVGTAFAGIGQGPLKGAATAWVGKHINVTNVMMSVFVVITAIGALWPTFLEGHIFNDSPNIFLYVYFAGTMLAVAFFICMGLYLRELPLHCMRKHNWA